MGEKSLSNKIVKRTEVFRAPFTSGQRILTSFEMTKNVVCFRNPLILLYESAMGQKEIIDDSLHEFIFNSSIFYRCQQNLPCSEQERK